MCWWSKTYKRPLKDPILLSYTFEELLFEYYDKIIREEEENARNVLGDTSDEFSDKEIEESIEWIKQQEALDRSELAVDESSNDEDISDIGEDLIIDDF
jgi:hypothetical protein